MNNIYTSFILEKIYPFCHFLQNMYDLGGSARFCRGSTDGWRSLQNRHNRSLHVRMSAIASRVGCTHTRLDFLDSLGYFGE